MALTKVRGGGVDTVVLADSTNLNFGTGSDAKIFHDGNNTKFQHTGTGGLYIGADTFAITNGATDTNHISIDSNGHVTMPKQPAFLVEMSADQNNVSSGTTVVFGSEVFDQNGDFASNTFTAPVTGKYQLSYCLRIDNVESDATYTRTRLVTSNRTVQPTIYDLRNLSGDPAYWFFGLSILADMDANDTAYIQFNQSGGSTQADIKIHSFFSGYLAC